jgi:hypothetical protein
MKTFTLIFLMLLITTLKAQVAVNTDGANPDNSAMLDVKSTFKGVLFPRMTSSEREAIASPATGLTVYDLTTQSYWYYNGSAWTTIGNGIWTQNGNDIYSNISGNAGIGTTTPEDKLHLFNSTNLRILIETPDNFYAGVRTRNSQREYFMGTIGNRWSVFDNYDGSEDISVLPDGNVGIATTTPDPSAALDVSSTTKGFLPPRMTIEQRDAITPIAGLMIYNTTTNKPNYYNGAEWMNYDGTPAILQVGDSYQGGIIAWVLAPGDPGYIAGEFHGLIATPGNQTAGSPWGCYGAITGADGTALGTGNQNTIDILAGCADAGIAARICGDLDLNGYSDWYLPSIDELNKLYLNRAVIGGFVNTAYWSSSETSPNNAWLLNFVTGAQLSIGKFNNNYVRAVRAF